MAVTLAVVLIPACTAPAGTDDQAVTSASSATPTGIGDTVATPRTVPPADVTPLASALETTGPAVLADGVVTLDPAQLHEISADGVRFTVAAAEGLQPGAVLLVPGVAARRITAVSGDAEEVVLDTTQASLDEIFADLDIDFGGEPEPAALLLADAAAGGALGEYDDAPGFRRVDRGIPAAARPAAATCAKTAASQTVAMPKFSAGPYQITSSAAIVPDCRSLSFTIDAARGDGAAMKVTLAGSATIGAIRGHATNRPGQQSTLAVDLDTSVNVSLTAATSASTVDRAKVSWDALKIDIPILLAGVPVVIRVGFPLLIEARFSGGADTVTGNLISMTCKGTVTVARDADTPQSICTMQPASITQIMSLAPTAVVIAAGPKLGFGIGTVVAGSAVLFTGATATLAGAVGVTYSGGTGIPVTECTRIDRSVSLNVGGELTVMGMSASMSRQVWVKEATDQEGQRCRPA